VSRLWGVGLLLLVTAACSSSGHKASSSTSTSTSTSTTATTVPATTTSTAVPTTKVTVDTNVKVYGDCKTATVEPKEIILTCADLGEIVQGVSWSSWTATSATGVGTWLYKDCTPSCATGKSRTLPNTHITLTTPVSDPSGQRVWSQLEASQFPPGLTGPQSIPTQPG
jgi:hypothetical protein